MSATNLSAVWNELELLARRNGVLAIGASSLQDAQAHLFERWLAAGYGGSMSYLQRHLAVRLAPQERFPWARSVVGITVPYSPERNAPDDTIGAHIARYALGDDYHDVVAEILRELELRLKSLVPSVETWRYVDTGPLSDRSMAAQAGLGWIGRNGMLIDEQRGSYFFIGLLLTSMENDLNAQPAADRCGSCTRCVEACPTEAILPGRIVDSNRCISHATIEQRGAIDDSIKERLEGNLFGCDICQEVCPWNRFAPQGHARFEMREEYRATPISDLLRGDQTYFSNLFHHSAVKRARRAGLLRNAVAISDDVEPDLLGDENDEGVVDALRWRAESGRT